MAREVAIIQVEGHDGATLGMDEEAIREVDIDLCGAQGVEAGHELFAKLTKGDDDELADSMGNALFNKKRFGGLGIAQHETSDGSIAGVLHAQAHDVDVRSLEKVGEGDESSGTIGKQHRELPNGVSCG